MDERSQSIVAGERSLRRQHLEQHAAKRPDVGALSTGVRAPAPAPCRPRCRGSCRICVIAGGRERRRVLGAFGCPLTAGRRRPIAFAKPKSSTFTVPSSRTLMLAGFRSRWTMPRSCAASSASAICLAIGSASSSGIAPRAIRSDEILALDEFHHEAGRRSMSSSRRSARCSDGSARRGLRFARRSARAARGRPRTARAAP